MVDNLKSIFSHFRQLNFTHFSYYDGKFMSVFGGQFKSISNHFMVFSPNSQRVALGYQINFQKNMTRENSYQPDAMRSLFLIRLGKSSGVRPTNIE